MRISKETPANIGAATTDNAAPSVQPDSPADVERRQRQALMDELQRENTAANLAREL